MICLDHSHRPRTILAVWLAVVIEVELSSAGEYDIRFSRAQTRGDGGTVGSWKSEGELRVVSPFEASVKPRGGKRVELLRYPHTAG
jgi:hypothetical protein